MKVQNNICSKGALAGQLVEKIKAIMPEQNSGRERLYRFVVDVDELAPLDWLGVQQKRPRIYWSNRERNFETAGVGAAQILRDEPTFSTKNALETIEDNLTLAEGDVRYYGGICFDQDDCSEPSWQKFGRFYFIVPEFEMCKLNDKVIFVFNVLYKSGCHRDGIVEQLQNSLKELVFSDEYANQPFTAKVSSRMDCPDESEWKENILQAIDVLRLEEIKKIVLSRKSIFQMSQAIDPVGLLKQVSNKSINTYDFCFELDESNAFLGCSPECLYRKNQNDIYTEAIAGTCLAGKTDAEQRCFQEKFLNSHKEAEEHKYVFDDVKADLNKICRQTYVLDKRDILSLNYVQHFRSRFRGTLKNDISAHKIIETLHPTAAVHGYPKQAAKDVIKKYEPFSRGWYAGPVGWIGADCAEFAVGIRSGLLRGKELSLFAGAGIVKSSDPASEWDETENKIKPFLEVII